MNNLNVRRGDIYYADLSPVVGSEQGGIRPVLILQNDVGNRYSPTVIAAAITSRMSKTKLPTHIDIYADRAGLQKDSVILLEQMRTIDKKEKRDIMSLAEIQERRSKIAKGEVVVYPNPVVTQITVKTESTQGTIVLRTIDGRIVKELSINGNSTEIPVNGLPAGEYVIQINDNTNVTTKNIIVR